MKFSILYLFLFALPLFMHCNDNDKITPEIPDCIQQKTLEILNQDVWDPPAKIYRYLYEGDTVYFIPQRCCDFYSELYDKDCNLICAPDGGIGGDGDGKCPDFFDKRTNEVLIWEDTRK